MGMSMQECKSTSPVLAPCGGQARLSRSRGNVGRMMDARTEITGSLNTRIAGRRLTDPSIVKVLVADCWPVTSLQHCTSPSEAEKGLSL